MPCVSFSMRDCPGGTAWHRKASAKNSSKLNKFLHSEVNLLIQHKLFLLVLQRMNSLKYNFIMLNNEMESYVRIGGRGLNNLTCTYM